MTVSRDMPVNQRLDRIGELLAKGVYLYLKNQKDMTADEKSLLANGKSKMYNPPIVKSGASQPDD